MKFSTRGRYGIVLMVDLAMSDGSSPISLKSIAERQELSEHYLEQLVAPLRNAGLVRSIRGAYGGYTLAKPASEITTGDVIRILEGPITVADEPDELLDDLWNQLRDQINEVLDETTIEKLAERKKQNDQNYMFYI